jgi:hypothetical protein
MNSFNKNKKNIFSKLQKYFLIGACALVVFLAAGTINAAPANNTTAPAQTPTGQNTAPASSSATANNSNEEPGWWKTHSMNPIKNLLFAIFTLVSWIFLFAVVIFEWILKPDNFKLFLDSPAVREIWVMVRDFLNIGFIFFLLFSAFATIFQIDKYHIKSMIFKLILMALLVNFSFPISRFIIDVSNVTMYWLLNNIFDNMSGGAGIMATIAGDTGIAKTLLPEQANSEIARIIAATLFLFIFGITMLIIGVMFIIRLIALSVLVMFSSIGFAAAAFPLTSKYASSWWDSLFKYSFFAPIMVFGMAISIKLMQSIGNSAQKSMLDVANNQAVAAAEPNFIAQGAFFAIPVVILWATMGIAQKFSIEGAGAVTGQGKKLASWAGNLPSRGVKAGWNATGVPGGVKAGVAKFQKNGKLFGVKVPGYGGSDAREAREARITGLVAGGLTGARSATENRKRKLVADKVDEYKKSGLGASQIEKDLTSNDEVTRMAAAMHMNEKGELNNISRIQKALAAVGNDVDARSKIIDKISNTAAIFQNAGDYNAALTTALNGIDMSTPDGLDNANKIRKGFEAKFKKDNRMDVILDHDVNYGIHDPHNSNAHGKTSEQIYEERLGDFSPEDLAKQKNLHRNIGTNGHLQHYIRNNISNDPQRHLEMHRHMSTSNQRAYSDAGYAP